MAKRKTFNKDIIEDTLEKISRNISEKIKIYLIGGGAMIFYGRKVATKDIDIVFTNAEDLSLFSKSAIKAGFKPISEPGKEYNNIGAWMILENTVGIRLDLFNRKVCSALEITGSIRERAIPFEDYGNLKVYLMAPEDIVMFKGITERESDLEDIRILAESGINWNTVEEECLSQKDSEKWAILLLDKIKELKTRYGISPRLTKLHDLVDPYVLHETFRIILKDDELSFQEIHVRIKNETGYSESWTRKMLKQLEEKGFIKSRRKGRRKFYRVSKKS
jgi:hypothetical protein